MVYYIYIIGKASTVSLRDCYIRKGIWHEQIPMPCIPGFDLVGTIVDMGRTAEVRSELDVGDAVAACCLTGGNARYRVLKLKDLVFI